MLVVCHSFSVILLFTVKPNSDVTTAANIFNERNYKKNICFSVVLINIKSFHNHERYQDGRVAPANP